MSPNASPVRAFGFPTPVATPLQRSSLVSVPAQPAPSRRVLLVDDEEQVLRSLRRALHPQGWTVETAQGGEAGLRIAQEFQPQVVVSDFQMPGMTGVEFLSRVKALLPHSQRIMLTGHADPRAVTDAINRSEVFRFIAKPWDNTELVATVLTAFVHVELAEENRRLHEITQTQNDQLKTATSLLEERVGERTGQLSAAKREWETAFDAIATPLALVDEGFRVVRANRAYAAAAKRPVTDVGEHPRCHQYLFGRETPCPSCPLGSALASRQRAVGQVSHLGREYQVAIYPVPEEQRAVCTYRDVTEEHQLTRRQIDTEKMAAVGQLAGGVAHEINNPLGGILAFAQLMKRDPGRSAQDLEALDLVEESALRCKRIVESLLKFSRRSSSDERKPLDLAKCIEETAVLFRAQLKSSPRARLEVALAPQLPSVSGNANQLGQVALNLLQNGLHALNKGEGTLTLEAGASRDGCFFRVSDTGSGIRPEHLPQLFEPWFTTKPPGEGTGLGLAIAHRIVADHGGTIQVESELGKGSRFTVNLPTISTP